MGFIGLAVEFWGIGLRDFQRPGLQDILWTYLNTFSGVFGEQILVFGVRWPRGVELIASRFLVVLDHAL